MNKNLFALVDMRERVYFTGTFHQTAEFAEREANGILSNLIYVIREAEDGTRKKISLEDIRKWTLRREGGRFVSDYYSEESYKKNTNYLTSETERLF